MKHFLFALSLLVYSHFGFADDEEQLLPPTDPCEHYIYESQPFFQEGVFIHCLDTCFLEIEKGSVKDMTCLLDNNSFKRFCELDAWGYRMMKLKHYSDCVEQNRASDQVVPPLPKGTAM